MRTLDRREFLTYCAAGASLLAVPAIAQTSTAPNPPFTDLLTAIPEIMQRHGVPGLQIALIRDGQVAAFESFGVTNLETKTPLTAETLFEAASLTKPVFAYVVMKLSEEGVLDLDAPLNDIVEAPASGPPELVQGLTARLVLSHRTGFPNWYGGQDRPGLRPSQGTRFAYSGMAYQYLQKVVEKLTQKDLSALLHERIFQPLAMESAHTSAREVTPDRLADGHTPTGKVVRSQRIEPNAASSLVCTAQDYARFAAILAKPPATSNVYLKPETLKDVFTPYIEAAPNIHWGLGWGLQTPKAEPVMPFHWGNNYNAYNCFVVVNPTTAEGVVVMTNSGTGLRACADIVPRVMPGDHPALRWEMVIGR